MIASAPATAPVPTPTSPPPTTAATPAYSEKLATTRDRLAYVRAAPFDTQQRVDIGLGNLHTAAASLHDALSGVEAVDPKLPSGVREYPRDAAILISHAIDELDRGNRGSLVDGDVVHDLSNQAIGKLQTAIGLIAHPPSTEVFDGS